MRVPEVIFYSNSREYSVLNDIDKLPNTIQNKLYRALKYINEFGLNSAIPHTKKITNTPLWEIRILGKENYRLLYSQINNHQIMILHVFKKETQKTPKSDIQIGLRRRLDAINNQNTR